MSKIQNRALWSILVILLSGCETKEPTQLEPQASAPYRAKSQNVSVGGIQQESLGVDDRLSTGKFEKLTGEQTGLNFTNELQPQNIRKYLLNGSGLATGDFDNDGLVDVYAISQDGPNRLFRQVLPWQFKDITTQVGDLTGGDYKGTGAAFIDVDNDCLLYTSPSPRDRG